MIYLSDAYVASQISKMESADLSCCVAKFESDWFVVNSNHDCTQIDTLSHQFTSLVQIQLVDLTL